MPRRKRKDKKPVIRRKKNKQLKNTFREEYDDLLDFIDGFKADNGFSPTLDEIGNACHMSRSTVSRVVEVLAARGKINYVPGIPRTINVTREPDNDGA